MIFLIRYPFPHTPKLLRDISPRLLPGVLRGGDNSHSSLGLSDGMCQAKKKDVLAGNYEKERNLMVKAYANIFLFDKSSPVRL
jgi:hypothetical protein